MKTLVAAVGSTILTDDGVGIHALRRLRREYPQGSFDLLEIGTGGLSLLDFVEGYDRVIVLDAIVTGAAPGTVHELRGEAVASTVHLAAIHEADLPATLALGRKLARHMPGEVIVLAVEAADVTTFSEHLTPEVEDALPALLARLKSLLEDGSLA